MGYTFKFSFSSPEPAKSGNCSKTKKAGRNAATEKHRQHTPQKGSAKGDEVKLHTKLDSASMEAKKQKRTEYGQQRNQTPWRKEQVRLIAQEHRRKAKGSASAGTAASRPSQARRAVKPAPRTTGSHAGAATPDEEAWRNKRNIQRKCTQLT